MKLIMPDHAKKFKCIASQCRDNCCIGWGICIDDKTAEKYAAVKGKFGERLLNSIDHGEQCFMNDPATKRCPFLNENNLCDIITELGEEMLCHICHRHPRYFEWYDDFIEGGIGLCCEEAARLILGDTSHGTYETEAPPSLAEESDEETDEEAIDEAYLAFLKKARERIIGLLLDEKIPLNDALDTLVSYAEQLQDCTDFYDIEEVPEFAEKQPFDTLDAIRLLQSAETANDEQADYLKGLLEYVSARGGHHEIRAENVPELRNIAVYFIRRYFLPAVFSGDLYPKLMFAVFGTRVINAMFSYAARGGNSPDFEEKCALAKFFSKLVEYSEDNLEKIFDHYYYE